MSSAPGVIDYLKSPYIIEFIVVLLLGWFLRSPWRIAVRMHVFSLTGWRGFSLMVGWLCLVLATAAWLFLVYLTVSALHTSFDPALPKPATLIFVVVGGFAYLMIIGFSGLAFDAALGRFGDRRRDNSDRGS